MAARTPQFKMEAAGCVRRIAAHETAIWSREQHACAGRWIAPPPHLLPAEDRWRSPARGLSGRACALEQGSPNPTAPQPLLPSPCRTAGGEQWASEASSFAPHRSHYRLNHPPAPPVRRKIVFPETGPWCQKGWGPLLLERASTSPLFDHRRKVSFASQQNFVSFCWLERYRAGGPLKVLVTLWL